MRLRERSEVRAVENFHDSATAVPIIVLRHRLPRPTPLFSNVLALTEPRTRRRWGFRRTGEALRDCHPGRGGFTDDF